MVGLNNLIRGRLPSTGVVNKKSEDSSLAYP